MYFFNNCDLFFFKATNIQLNYSCDSHGHRSCLGIKLLVVLAVGKVFPAFNCRLFWLCLAQGACATFVLSG